MSCIGPPQNIWQCKSNLSKHATVMSRLILGLYQWPLTGVAVLHVSHPPSAVVWRGKRVGGGGFKRKRQVEGLGAETWIADGGLLVAFSMAMLSPPPTVWLPTSQPPIPCFTHPPAALALLSAPSHPYDSKDPQAAGVDDTCQQRDSVSTVSDSRPASLSPPLSLWLMHTYLQASYMCTAKFTLKRSLKHTHAHTHKFPDTSWQYTICQLIIRGRPHWEEENLNEWSYRHYMGQYFSF